MSLTHSELLAALEELSASPHGKDLGYRTTDEMAKPIAVKDGITLESAKKRVREMLNAARVLGRLDRGRVRVAALDGYRMVAAYKLKPPAKG